jgi:hypothetical protein
MKKIFIFCLAVLPLALNAQFELHHHGEPIGPSFAVDSATSSVDHFEVELYVVNTGATDKVANFSRVRNYHKSGWNDQICDSQICFDADDETTWFRPENPGLTIAAGDSTIFQVKVYPNQIDGCSVYTYHIKSGAIGVQEDSIQITYTIGGANCFLNIEDEKILPSFSVYPNPANDIVNISIENANGVSISIFDIVGKEVSNMDLVNGKNQLNIENLNAGVYFYSIRKNNETIETKKLVVR